MKKAIIILIGGAIVLACTEAIAQSWGNNYYGHNRYYNTQQSYNYNPYWYSNQSYGGFSSGSRKNHRHGGEVYIQNGYFKRNGTYVAPHFKTRPDNYRWNNLKNNGW